MKTIFTNSFLLILGCLLFNSSVNAQNGLENVIVEKYYISNAADSIGSVGVLPVGSVTYRIYVDMRQGYNFQMAYGNANHHLTFNTTTSFFNNEDYGSTTPNFSKNNAAKNTVMLDSWLSAGAACTGNFGILKSEDNGVANINNTNGLLHNTNPAAGIPLTTQDGLITGTPGSVGMLGLDTAITVFDATSQAGNSFVVKNGAWYCLAGATGPDTTNKVLIAQITTKGTLTFKLNIQIGTPSGGTEQYVADNPAGAEIQQAYLTYSSDTLTTSVKELDNNFSLSVFPNPSNGVFTLNVNTKDQNVTGYYRIYDVLGNMLITKKINVGLPNFKENIDINSYSKGLYFIEVSLNGEMTTCKLIKN